MAEYKYDVLNDIDSEELLQELGERLGVQLGDQTARQKSLTLALEHNREMKELLRMVYINIDAGVEPRHILRHMKSKREFWR